MTLDLRQNTATKYLDVSDNPLLGKVCVWEGFNIESIDVDTAISPNVYFTTDCNVSTVLAECDQETISVYPNPTNSLLTVETEEPGIHEIDIISLNGQQFIYKELIGASLQLDLSFLKPGIYVMTIRSMDFVTTRKIIKL